MSCCIESIIYGLLPVDATRTHRQGVPVAREDGQDTAKVVEFEADRRVNRFVPTYSVRENGEYWLSKNGTRRAWSTRDAAEEAMHTERSLAHLRRLNEQLAAECDRLRALVKQFKAHSHYSEPTFVCAYCEREAPSENGAADDMPDACDACWNDITGARRAEAQNR